MINKFGYVVIDTKKEFESLEFIPCSSSFSFRISNIGLVYNYDNKELTFPLYLRKIQESTGGCCALYEVSNKEEMIKSLSSIIEEINGIIQNNTWQNKKQVL